jgi:hypothetical protein
MSNKRFFYILSGCLALLILLIGGAVYMGNSLIEKQAKKLVELRAQSLTIDAQQTSLIQAKKDIEQYTELNNIAKSIVPQDKDQAKTIREINKIAEDSGIELKAIAFQTSTLGQIQAAPKPVEGETAPATPAAPTITQVKPVQGISGVYSLEITISPARPISYRSFLSFLERLEANRRTAHVEKIGINPTPDGRNLTFTLTLNSYVKS